MSSHNEESGPYVLNKENSTLEQWRQRKFGLINERTGQLIVEGGFPYNGKIFSMSQAAQLNMLGAERKKDVQGVLPLTFNTLDDMDTETLTTPTEVDNFFMSAMVAKITAYDSGTALKDQVRAATTKDEIDAVVDNR